MCHSQGHKSGASGVQTQDLSLQKHAHVTNRDFFSCEIRKIQWKFFDIFNSFVQNMYCGYTLEPPQPGGVLMSTHNLCFGSKITKLGLSLHTPVLLNKRGLRGYRLLRHVLVM